MKRLMISALHSGSGKTVVTLGLLAAISRRGLSVESFKCGPDYLDPLFHRQVLGIAGHNLDPFLQGSRMHRILAGQRADVALVEGAMGYFDGRKMTPEGSSWEIAATENLPVLLCLRPSGVSVTLAAQIRGLQAFRKPDRLRGLFLCDCRESLAQRLSPMLEAETGLPVTGFLPPMEAAAFSSRHLGLVCPEEMGEMSHRIRALGDQMARTGNPESILALAEQAPSAERKSPVPAAHDRVRVAVSRDAAFCFCYQETLEALEEAGADLLFFSPLSDKSLPPCDGLLLCGGYPELHARQLQENDSMRESIRCAVLGGLPTVAECGGFLYLLQGLEGVDGKRCEMAGVLPGEGVAGHRLLRFGYVKLTAREDSLLFRKGEQVPAHEFHHWESTFCGTDLMASGNHNYSCGVATPSLYAGFPHLCMAGDVPLAERFVGACRERRRRDGKAEPGAN